MLIAEISIIFKLTYYF